MMSCRHTHAVVFVFVFVCVCICIYIYIYIYIYIKVSTSYGASIENPICSMMLYFIKTVWGLEIF